jgi:hypothetical protein
MGCSGSRSPGRRGRRRRLPQRPWRELAAPAFEVDADRPVPAGIDGEAATLQLPLLFRIRPRALRVRIAPRHPGASPSAMLPEGVTQSVLALVRIAAGRGLAAGEPAHTPSTPNHHQGDVMQSLRSNLRREEAAAPLRNLADTA